MAVALADTIEAALTMSGQVLRDPESPAAGMSVDQMVRNIDRFLASPEITAILRVDPASLRDLGERLSPAAQRVVALMQETLSVALQIRELGGRVDWVDALDRAIERFVHTLTRLGVARPPSELPVPPMVTRTHDPDGRPRFRVVVELARRPHLEPYIARALQRAALSEIEPGHWYAEIEGFPGVWADGASPEECRAALADVLHEWLIVKFGQGYRDLPVLGDLDPMALIVRG